MTNPLVDKQFLKDLDLHRNRDVYIKIIALNNLELPVEEIIGKATSGSISIDGNSAVRRTCSLSLVAEEVNITDYYWALNTKFKVFIGLKNTIDTLKYEDIIWFPQGMYVITSFSTSINTNSYSINISGKDKMCMLNGENGGTLPAEVILDTMQEKPDAQGNIAVNQIPIYEIIFYLISQFGREKIQNIIIEDLQENSYNLLDYHGSKTLYLLKDWQRNIVNITLDDQIECWIPTFEIIEDGQEIIKSWTKSTIGQKENQEDQLIQYDYISNIINLNPTKVYFSEMEPPTGDLSESLTFYTIVKIESGQALGYEENGELYYPSKGSLVAKAGESITSVLDKIKKVLGEYEYFYDLEGKFVFREKPNYLKTSWTPVVEDEIGGFYIEPLAAAKEYDYSFEGSELITSISNSPKIDNVKNDYCIWGQRDSVSGSSLPIHIRCAIDKKPQYYCSPWFLNNLGNKEGQIEGQEFATFDYKGKFLTANPIIADWREIIYQMAKDYIDYHTLPNFLYTIRNCGLNIEFYPEGTTGYEQYYLDLEGFWRQLYNPFYSNSPREDLNNKTNNFNTADYFLNDKVQIKYWNKQIATNPEQLNFWFDFFEFNNEQQLEKYSVQNIGDRSKIANDNSVKSIYYRKTPDILLTTDGEVGTVDLETGWMRLRITNEFRDQYLSISSQGKSASDAIAEYLYQHTNASDSISISCIPIYYLQPNTRIWINDKDTNIQGEYIITKLTIPLTYNGTMSISATKVLQKLT